MIINFVLITALLISLITDIKKRKILNIVTLPAILFGIIYNTSFRGLEGFFYSGKGLLIGFVLLLIPYMLGGMGAGDVKLMASIGALMGTSFVLYSFIYTAVIGGFISVILVFKKYGIKNSVKSLLFQVFYFRGSFKALINIDKSKSISFPYGIAIVLGTLITFIWGGVK